MADREVNSLFLNDMVIFSQLIHDLLTKPGNDDSAYHPDRHQRQDARAGYIWICLS